MTHSPIICAIDTTDIERARLMVEQVEGSVGAIKLGLEFFTANGVSGVKQVMAQSNVPLFLDLKFHDIPNTVAKAIEATAGIDTFMMTVHVSGGQTMLRRATDASMRVAETTGQTRPLIIGVTILTSMDQDDLMMIGLRDTLNDQVKRMADLAQSAGLDGVVCSPYEISLIRKVCGHDFKLVVPGVRPEGSSADDQKRVMTPKEAYARGADYLVIGRPITANADPKKAAQMIASSLAS
ncbi:MAG: orotidine-5'-phosphate decarboxylase [Rickettsiales bacterium]|nr:orotidine-5'-phosphate decarboxylase [Rickettsiales bacterium]